MSYLARQSADDHAPAQVIGLAGLGDLSSELKIVRLNCSRLEESGRSQVWMSPFWVMTTVLTARQSYSISLSPLEGDKSPPSGLLPGQRTSREAY